MLKGTKEGTRREHPIIIDLVRDEECPEGGKHDWKYICFSDKCTKCKKVVFVDLEN